MFAPLYDLILEVQNVGRRHMEKYESRDMTDVQELANFKIFNRPPFQLALCQTASLSALFTLRSIQKPQNDFYFVFIVNGNEEVNLGVLVEVNVLESCSF